MAPRTPAAVRALPSLALALAALAVALAVVAGGATPAQAQSPIHLDNRASAIAGHRNGELPADLLLWAAPTCRVYGPAAPSIITMMADAHRDGVNLRPLECYRDYAGQVAARENACATNGCHMAAVPGSSNHGWAKAVDLRDQQGTLRYDSAGYHWLEANAWRYGWNHPGVMKEGGPVPEPWHWEWVGDGGRMFPGMSYGVGDGVGLISDGSPGGSLDSATNVVDAPEGRLRVTGWAIDPNTTASIEVHLYLDGSIAGSFRANKPRPDVAQLLAGYDPSPHGFEAEIPAGYGPHTVCAYGIDAVRPGGNKLLGCTQARVGREPIGALDAVEVTAQGIVVRGWAADADADGPSDVRIEAGPSGNRRVTADRPRPDVGAAYPALGAAHGYAATIEDPAHGTYDVCVRAINEGPGDHVVLGCRRVVVDRNPFGTIDSARALPGAVRLGGWATDPDTAAPIDVHVYVNGAFATAAPTGVARPDVAAAFPTAGPRAGFDLVVPARHGANTVCLFAINVGAGSTHPHLGCRTVQVTNHQPFGSLDGAQGVEGGVRVGGWAIDRDTTAPIDVHVYVSGQGHALTAGLPRPDVAAAYPGTGSAHGFDQVLPAPAGRHDVCAWAIDLTGGGPHTLLGCRAVVVPVPPESARNPYGVVDVVDAIPGAVRVWGWAADPDTTDPLTVDVTVDGAPALRATTNVARPDVVAVFPSAGPTTGFRLVVAASPGEHVVCVVARNVGWGTADASLGCRTVTV